MIQIVFTFLFLFLIKADLPIKCLRPDVIGKWNLIISHTLHSEFERNSCGYHSPSTESTSYQTANLHFNNPSFLSLHLDANSSVLSQELTTIGSWTMVYYQSMEINLHHSFYVNFKYIPKKKLSNEYLSICNETLAGWWEDRKSGEKGCFKAYKDKEGNEKAIGVSEEKSNYRSHKILNRFFFGQSDTLNNNKKVKDIIEEINAKNMIWKAGVDKSFENLNMNQLKEKFHLKNRMFERRDASKKSNHFFDLKKKSTQTKHHLDDGLINSLPKNLDLSYLISKVNNQKCGNCYMQSTVSMYEARIKYKFGEDLNLSREFYNDCDYYNQGCEGGYTLPLSRFAKEFGLIEQNFFSQNQDCTKVNQWPKKYAVSDY